jgi:hypothetical protein
MKLLNPLYDTVFKYLLEDLEVAKTIIEAIIKKQVIELTPAPQESTDIKLQIKHIAIGMIRQDYVAIIKTIDEAGNEIAEKVMIEIQKSPFIPEIGRFRNYLADKYRRKSAVDGEEKYIPIKTIYLIEDVFNPKLPAVLGRKGIYIDELENTPYIGERDKVVELFNHDSWFIQTELLPEEFKDELYYVLSIFAPNFRKSPKDRYIDIQDEELLIKKHRIMERILRRLQAATQDREVNTALEIEIDYEKYLEKIIQNSEQAQKREEEAKQREEEAKQREEEAKQREEEAKQREEEAKQREEEAKQREEKAKLKLNELVKLFHSLNIPVETIIEKTGLTKTEIEDLLK